MLILARRRRKASSDRVNLFGAAAAVYVDFVMSCGDGGRRLCCCWWNAWNPFGLLRSMIQKAAAGGAAAGWGEEGRCLGLASGDHRGSKISLARAHCSKAEPF